MHESKINFDGEHKLEKADDNAHEKGEQSEQKILMGSITTKKVKYEHTYRALNTKPIIQQQQQQTWLPNELLLQQTANLVR